MCHKLDPVFFAELKGLDPKDVCRRSLARYDKDRGVYLVTSMEREYEVDPAACEIRAPDEERPVSVELGLLILFYLLKAQDVPLSGKWVSELDLAGGSMFFRGPHIIRNQEVAGRYGRDAEGFSEACRGLGGEPVEMGDAAFKIRVLPRVPVIVVLWLADEEFDASAKLLMDSTIEKHLPLDIIFGMALELLGRIVGKVLWH